MTNINLSELKNQLKTYHQVEELDLLEALRKRSGQVVSWGMSDANGRYHCRYRAIFKCGNEFHSIQDELEHSIAHFLGTIQRVSPGCLTRFRTPQAMLEHIREDHKKTTG
jgi:hypothetical protein